MFLIARTEFGKIPVTNNLRIYLAVPGPSTTTLLLEFSCIFFAILALPLGIKSHRAAKSRGFSLGLIVVSAYYLLRIGGEALVETGRLSPAVGVWTPNLFFAVLGIYLFYMAYKEISPLHIAKIYLWHKL